MKIVVVDDLQSNLEFFRRVLSNEFIVETFSNHEQALESISLCRPDLIILDCIMPGVDGHQLLMKIKRIYNEIPVIMVSGYHNEDNLVKAMDLSVDDFIFKPVMVDELIARVKNKINKYKKNINVNAIDEELEKLSDEILFDEVDEKVIIDSMDYHLKGKEFRLLKYLASRKNQLVTREEIFINVWEDIHVSPATLDTHLCQLRRKLGPHGNRVVTRKNTGFLYSTPFELGFS